MKGGKPKGGKTGSKGAKAKGTGKGFQAWSTTSTKAKGKGKGKNKGPGKWKKARNAKVMAARGPGSTLTNRCGGTHHVTLYADDERSLGSRLAVVGKDRRTVQ